MNTATTKPSHMTAYGMLLVVIAGLLLLMTLLAPAAVHASVTAHIDRDSVNEGETFTLTLKVTGSDDGQPVVTPLQKDFEVLGTGQRSEVQIINGSVESHRAWTITLSPRHTGNLVIPPITVGNSSSNALAISVLPATASSGGTGDQGDVFIEVNVKPDKVYVQAQLLYTVRLYYATPLRQGNLSEPTLDNAIVQKLGDDSKFETQRNGRDYQVIERRYAIFPQRSGALEIPAVVFDGDVDDPSRSGLDPFFDNFNPSTHHVRLRSRTLDVQVNAQPATYRGANWLPAQNVSLEEKWSPEKPQFRVGDPVTRTVIIHAKGLSASQLPDLPQPDQPGLKLYPDQPQTHSSTSGGALVSEREEKIAMIPTQAGDLTLPAIHLDWWDTETEHERSADLPARTIHVLPALSSASGTAAIPAPVSAGPVPQSKSEKAETAPTPAGNGTAVSETSSGTPATKIWIGLAILFALAWIITLLFWWRTRRSPRVEHVIQAEPDDVRRQAAVKRVRQACQDNDTQALKAALLEWARMRWPKEPPLSLGALARQVDDDGLAAEIARLNRFLYEANASEWQSERLQKHFADYLKHYANQKHMNDSDALEPLHLNKTRASGG